MMEIHGKQAESNATFSTLIKFDTRHSIYIFFLSLNDYDHRFVRQTTCPFFYIKMSFEKKNS